MVKTIKILKKDIDSLAKLVWLIDRPSISAYQLGTTFRARSNVLRRILKVLEAK